jgi:acyl carrier protein
VKIRGFRIELGEIESVLARHNQVREAVVVAREDTPGAKRLVAYVVPAQGFEPEISGLRALLQEKLPDYMVPASFVFLETLPLTPNGKVDRKALPAPDGIRPELEKTYVAPRTSVEETLAGIWSQVLGIDQVGIHDNFFALGGHSLLATQVISRLREGFQIELPLRNIFETPTIDRLSKVIEGLTVNKMSSKEVQMPELKQVSRESNRIKVSSQGKLEIPEGFSDKLFENIKVRREE